MLTITEGAVKKFKEFIKEIGTAQGGIRIFLMQGG